MPVRFLILSGLMSMVSAHLGVSDPAPIDHGAGDNHRSPVKPGQACHGQGADKAKFAWVWTPIFSGQCEIYQNCFESLPASGSLKFGMGVAHGGGPCHLYKCSGPITVPPCERKTLPESYGSCVTVAKDFDCSKKGSFTYANIDVSGGAANPTAVTPTDEIGTFPPGLKASTIRCGTSWEDASGKCGTQCKTDTDCKSAGEKCFADLLDCPAGSTSPEEAATRELPDSSPPGCVSAQPHLTDRFCQSVKCISVFSEQCKTSGPSAEFVGLTIKTCQPYATLAGQTWADVAIKFDTNMAALKFANSHITTELTTDTVVELPGDCQLARSQVQAQAQQITSGTAMLTAPLVLAILPFV